MHLSDGLLPLCDFFITAPLTSLASSHNIVSTFSIQCGFGRRDFCGTPKGDKSCALSSLKMITTVNEEIIDTGMENTEIAGLREKDKERVQYSTRAPLRYVYAHGI